MAYIPLEERIKLAEEFKSKYEKTISRVERFNELINSLEFRLDECHPDIAAYFVDATEVLNEAFYIDGISKSNYAAGKRRIDNLAKGFYNQCLCRNIKKSE